MNIETKVFNECQRMDLWLTNQKVAAETRELAVWFEEKKIASKWPNDSFLISKFLS